jgi:uncharacterized protein (DUF488 family)
MIEALPVLFTVGHGTADEETLLQRLHDAGVTAVVDVRAFPGSRRHPVMSRSAMERWLPAGGVGYRWEPRLGGRRPDPPGSPDTALRVRSFAGFAAHLRTPEAAAALDALRGATQAFPVGGPPTAVLCSEAVWWRCHRRLVADAMVLRHGVEVRHVLPDGRVAAHHLTEGVRMRDDGQLVYDAGQEALS